MFVGGRAPRVFSGRKLKVVESLAIVGFTRIHSEASPSSSRYSFGKVFVDNKVFFLLSSERNGEVRLSDGLGVGVGVFDLAERLRPRCR